VPGIGAHGVEVAGGLPVQKAAGQGRIGIRGADITGAAAGDPVVDLSVRSLLEGSDHIQNAVAVAGAEVDDQRPRPEDAVVGPRVLTFEVFERRHVSLDQIHHVDVVPDARAIRRRIVVAEDVQAFQSPCGDAAHIGHEIVGDALRRLADEAAFMGADGVEVSQEGNFPARIGDEEIAQDLFDHQFAPALGIGRRQGEILADGDGRGIAVNRGGRAENQRFHLMRGHDPAENQGGVQVVVVITEGLRDGFADGLEPREVKHGVDGVRPKNRGQGGLIPEILRIKCGTSARDGLDPVQDGGIAVAEIVHYHGGIASPHEDDDGMTADKARAACDKNVRDYGDRDVVSSYARLDGADGFTRSINLVMGSYR